MADPVKVMIEADIKDLLSGLEKATGGFRHLARDIQASGNGISKTIDSIKAPFLALAGLVGGTAFLKGTIEETKDWTVEAQKLSRVLGITTEAASILNLAIGDIYGTQEEYLGAVSKLTKTLSTNEQAFKDLGVATRDQNGHLRPTPEIMADVNSKLMQMKSGTDRNVESQRIYGKSWMEVQRYLGLTREVMEAAREKAEKLNLVVGQDSVAATNAYRASVNDLEDTVKALKLRIGSELMPLITTLNNDLADNGPQAVDAFSKAFSGLYQMVNAIRETFRKLWENIQHGFNLAVLSFQTLVTIAKTKHVKEIEQALKEHNRKVEEEAKVHALTMKSIEDDYTDSTARLMGLGPKPKPAPAPTGSGRANQNPGKPPENVFAEERNRLEQEFARLSAGEGEAERVWAAQREVDLKREQELNKILKERKDGKLTKPEADELRQMVEVNTLEGHRVETIKEEQRQEKELEEWSKAYLKERAAMARELAQGQISAARDSLAGQREELDHLVNMERMTLQERLAAEKTFRQRELALEIQALNQQQAEYKKGTSEWEAVENKKAEATRRANLSIQQLDHQSLEARKAKWQEFFQSMTGGFSSAVKGLIKGTMDWGTAFLTVLDSALDGVIDFFVQWGLKAATTALANQAVGAASRATEGAGYAALWAVNAASSAAAIPVVGWAMAPGVAAEAYAQGMGWAALASAAGGWDRVPSDQLAMVHKNEMVMSAPLAEGIRGLVAGGGQGGGSGDHYHAHFHGVTDRSWWDANQGNILRQVATGWKNRRKP